jgi:hypothetical protein
MRFIQFLLATLLLTLAASSHAALNAYLQLTLEGETTPLTGDVTLSQIGGVDVTTGYIEIYETNLAIFSKGTVEPLVFLKRLDQTTPTLARALVEGIGVSGSLLIFDNDPDSGETRLRFTVSFDEGDLEQSAIQQPDGFEPSVSNRPVLESIRIKPGSLKLTDEINMTEYVFQAK